MPGKNEYRAVLDEAEKLLTEATTTAVTDRIALRDAVCAYLIVEQRNGSSTESVRKSIEAILIRAEVRVGKLNGHEELARELVDWCLDQIELGKPKIV